MAPPLRGTCAFQDPRKSLSGCHTQPPGDNGLLVLKVSTPGKCERRNGAPASLSGCNPLTSAQSEVLVSPRLMLRTRREPSWELGPFLQCSPHSCIAAFARGSEIPNHKFREPPLGSLSPRKVPWPLEEWSPYLQAAPELCLPRGWESGSLMVPPQERLPLYPDSRALG